MKAKKLNIVPFLNKQLGPVDTILDPKTNKYIYTHSLYYRITYTRQNTMIKSHSDKGYSESNLPIGLINKEMAEISAIIYYFTDGFKEDFDLKGLKKKYDVGLISVRQLVDDYIRGRIKKTLNQIDIPIVKAINVGKYSEDYQLITLLEAIKVLLPTQHSSILSELENEIKVYEYLKIVYPTEKKQPTIIDWVASDKVDNMFEKTLLAKKISLKEIKNAITTLTQIIEEKF